MSKNIYVNSTAFNHIKNKEKKIKGRIKKGLFNNIFIGENINFICNKTNTKCKAKITKINIYNSVYDFLKNENIHKVIPYCKNYNYALNVKNKHYGEKLKKKTFKFISIHVNII